MSSEVSLLCLACAERLGQRTWPSVPELVLGYCPQCGGTVPLAQLGMTLGGTPNEKLTNRSDSRAA